MDNYQTCKTRFTAQIMKHSHFLFLRNIFLAQWTNDKAFWPLICICLVSNLGTAILIELSSIRYQSFFSNFFKKNTLYFKQKRVHILVIIPYPNKQNPFSTTLTVFGNNIIYCTIYITLKSFDWKGAIVKGITIPSFRSIFIFHL